MGVKERREREKTQVRERILDAALEVFATEGVEGVTMRALADAIEYTPPVIYAHFRDKDAIIEELCYRQLRTLAKAFANFQALDPVERLRQIGYVYVDFAVKQNGKLDAMVNNAGWTHRNRPALEVSEEEFDRVYAINMKSIYLSTIHAVPAFRANRGGSFINIASTAGIRPRPGLAWYNGSKGAVITTSKSLAAEFGPDNIRVNCINPVFNPDTGLSAEFAGGPVDEARRAKFLATIPLGRFSTSLDVANAALYLASDEAAFISGVCIEVDGARCA